MSPRQSPQEAGLLPRLKKSFQRGVFLGGLFAWAAFCGTGCASRAPEIRAEPESRVVVPAAPRISLKAHHRSMMDKMRHSFVQADEIVIGTYTGTYTDGPEGRAYYFDQFRFFDKDTWSWGPEMSALLPVLFQDVNPELITAQEFKSLSPLDRTGICWDDYEGPRVVFLVEGVPMLLFLKQKYIETDNSSRRILIDTYPGTKECRAKDIFDLMLRDLAAKQ